MIFHDELRQLDREEPSYRLHLVLTEETGHLDLGTLGEVVEDWQDRSAWICGPSALLDSADSVWDEAGLTDQQHMERFTIARTDKGGEGGTVTIVGPNDPAEVVNALRSFPGLTVVPLRPAREGARIVDQG